MQNPKNYETNQLANIIRSFPKNVHYRRRMSVYFDSIFTPSRAESKETVNQLKV